MCDFRSETIAFKDFVCDRDVSESLSCEGVRRRRRTIPVPNGIALPGIRINNRASGVRFIGRHQLQIINRARGSFTVGNGLPRPSQI